MGFLKSKLPGGLSCEKRPAFVSLFCSALGCFGGGIMSDTISALLTARKRATRSNKDSNTRTGVI